MIRVVGLNKNVLELIPDNVLSYVDEDSGIVEFCEFHYIHTFQDHVEIYIEDAEGNKMAITFLYTDFYRIELE